MDTVVASLLVMSDHLHVRDKIRLCCTNKTLYETLFAHDESELAQVVQNELMRHSGKTRACFRRDKLSRLFRTAYCRECLRPSRSVARTALQTTVIVCKTCSLDLHGYSAMVDRKMIRRMFGRHTLQNVVAKVPVSRLGGNRACLYWLHAIMKKYKRSQVLDLVRLEE